MTHAPTRRGCANKKNNMLEGFIMLGVGAIIGSLAQRKAELFLRRLLAWLLDD